MSNKDFHLIMDEVLDYGCLKLQCNMKLDGFLASLGRDYDGRIWIASGKSGKIYDGKDFVLYAKEQHAKTNSEWSAKSVDRAYRYRSLLWMFQEVNPEWLKPGDFLKGEWFDAWSARTTTSSDKYSTIKFVNLEYRKDRFADGLTVYVYHTNNPAIYNQSFDHHYREVEFRDPLVFTKDYFDLDLDLVRTYEKFEHNLKKTRPEYWDNWILQQMKVAVSERLREDIMEEYNVVDILGAAEGVVIKTINDRTYKLITPEFRKLVKKS